MEEKPERMETIIYSMILPIFFIMESIPSLATAEEHGVMFGFDTLMQLM